MTPVEVDRAIRSWCRAVDVVEVSTELRRHRSGDILMLLRLSASLERGLFKADVEGVIDTLTLDRSEDGLNELQQVLVEGVRLVAQGTPPQWVYEWALGRFSSV